ncbi:MAG: 5'-methylthioadenosine/adenosylhomocysteine nucleosidase [Lachnospiraceae bacterium]|nr:5'-methylthioadenosine/adenosylhomocysteine nucleosidase [Lachnospiraceae bacterium]MBP5183772.1 5'-methylthioadenosine/adenosylhomocysteine nucleosidase [Lachnospiraceae bacterium]
MYFDGEREVVGIIAAMKAEIDDLKSRITDPGTVEISGITYVYGRLGKYDVVAAQCGIGKVFAAVCAQTMILTFKPGRIINIGVGGSLTPELDIGDIAIAESCVQHDMDTSAVGDPVGLISGINIINIPGDKEIADELLKTAEGLGIKAKRGVIASGDCFVSSSAKKKYIADTFNAIVCEMEGAAIGHVCYINNMRYCVVRAVSDNGDEDSGKDYVASLNKASAAALKLIYGYLN